MNAQDSIEELPPLIAGDFVDFYLFKQNHALLISHVLSRVGFAFYKCQQASID